MGGVRSCEGKWRKEGAGGREGGKGVLRLVVASVWCAVSAADWELCSAWVALCCGVCCAAGVIAVIAVLTRPGVLLKNAGHWAM